MVKKDGPDWQRFHDALQSVCEVVNEQIMSSEVGHEMFETNGSPAYPKMRIRFDIVRDASTRRLLVKGNVVRDASGIKYVTRKEQELPEGHQFVCDQPHDDEDFSYVCGIDFCRCMQ